jgi:hypothetical protein
MERYVLLMNVRIGTDSDVLRAVPDVRYLPLLCSNSCHGAGSASIIEVLPSKICKITRIADVEAAATRGTHPAWGKWQQRGCIVGLPIMVSDAPCHETSTPAVLYWAYMARSLL